MPKLFDPPVTGSGVDVGYTNLAKREAPQEERMVAKLEAMWEQYSPYADDNFREEFARHPEERFWEMAVACYLLSSGKTLRPRADAPKVGGQPDICVLEGEQKIWIEAIAPTRGASPQDQVPEVGGADGEVRVRRRPIREMQLRITSALRTKGQVVARYRRDGTVAADDLVLVAIGGAQFGILAGDVGVPLPLTAVYPIGDQYVTIDRETAEAVDTGHHYSGVIRREKGDVERTAFLVTDYAEISGLLWSRVSIGNMDRGVRPLVLIHNASAVRPFPKKWGVWDEEWLAEEDDSGWTFSNVLAVAPNS